jgi:hypothetical protein
MSGFPGCGLGVAPCRGSAPQARKFSPRRAPRCRNRCGNAHIRPGISAGADTRRWSSLDVVLQLEQKCPLGLQHRMLWAQLLILILCLYDAGGRQVRGCGWAMVSACVWRRPPAIGGMHVLWGEGAGGGVCGHTAASPSLLGGSPRGHHPMRCCSVQSWECEASSPDSSRPAMATESGVCVCARGGRRRGGGGREGAGGRGAGLEGAGAGRRAEWQRRGSNLRLSRR